LGLVQRVTRLPNVRLGVIHSTDNERRVAGSSLVPHGQTDGRLELGLAPPSAFGRGAWRRESRLGFCSRRARQPLNRQPIAEAYLAALAAGVDPLEDEGVRRAVVGAVAALGSVDLNEAPSLRVARKANAARPVTFTPGSSARTVPLGQVVVDELAAHLAVYGAAGDGSLFTDELGGPLTYETWKRIWRATGTTYKTHDLRHYSASALIAGGASVKQVQMILGHASAAVTLGGYAHLWPGDHDRARGILDAALADCVRTAEVVG
jgi:integrase